LNQKIKTYETSSFIDPSDLHAVRGGLIQTANAQSGCRTAYPVPPCVPDCPNSPWGPVQTTILNIGGDCEVQVDYVTRYACSLYWDVQIVSYQFLGVGDCPFNINDPDAALEAILFELLRVNPMDFPEPGSGGCVNTWRAANGTCWRRAGDCYIPCDNSGCCLTQYTICEGQDGDESIQKTAVIGGGNQCPPSPDPNNPCENVCN
jgi:hypothetical protein